MKNHPYLPALLGAALLVLSSAAPAEDDPPQKEKEANRELLSMHETVAEFQGLEYRLCRGLTARCPEQCGHSGEFATFKIVKYTKYEKKGEYGDPKQETFRIQVTDFHKKPIGNELAPTIATLKKGEKVLLAWRHDYVTTKGGSKYPERVVTELQKMKES